MAGTEPRPLTIIQHQQRADALLNDANASLRALINARSNATAAARARAVHLEEMYAAARLAEVHLHAADTMISARKNLGLENASGAPEAAPAQRVAKQAQRPR